MEPSNPKFCHPYEPYEIQLGFMRSLYDCIENRKVGIFESPTGTGKSLSLICGALTWLRDNKRRDFDESFGGRNDPDDWLAQAEIEIRRKEILREREELQQKLARFRDQEAKRRQHQHGKIPAKRARTVGTTSTQDADDEQFMLDDYDSEGDGFAVKATKGSGLSRPTQALLDKLKPPAETVGVDGSTTETKIVFCSRTHSQLTQFVHELRRVRPPSSMTSSDSGLVESIKHLPLGSRKNLCINEKVARLTSTTAINERCLELQKPGTAKAQKCSYLPTKEDQEVVESFRDLAIARVRDIEDIATIGKEMHVCPYYASRSAIGSSEILTLPYPLLLQKTAREALGVSVKGNVIIIDEAHNLMDAIADTLSISLRLGQLHIATQQLMTYVQKFKNKLKGKNRVYVTQVIRLLNSITACLEGLGGALKQEVEVTANQLMSGKGADQLRPHKLAQYIQESKLTYKVEGYIAAQAQADDSTAPRGFLMQFQSFLMVLMNPASEGRFFARRHEGDLVVRYVLLDPREHFRDIVQEARAVILAGGTMSPMSDYAHYLFSYLPTGRLQTFSSGHVIPKNNIYVEAIGRGPAGKELEFTFEKRKRETTVDELGQLLIRLIQHVPDGVVVFFPSYDYLARAVQGWKGTSILASLKAHKAVFEEVKGITVDDLLHEYTQAIDTGKGALMLSVVGGKLSEGINFSDKLGRAVVAVGLPFPNANSGEWKAKIEHVEATKLKQCNEERRLSDSEAQREAKAAGRDFYENACMRAVNQSIGRAIRHRNDYAAILLVDRRFSTDRIRKKLPAWIQGSIYAEGGGWQATEDRLKAFFEGKV